MIKNNLYIILLTIYQLYIINQSIQESNHTPLLFIEINVN